ncbi:hypothetical protein [Williamsia deligens]|uniref:Uncharacterized protein n=1 Tax=Williamsia deligens TaxID=321325 RepID=A0ABW3GAW6_9NOCA|nr:hypothetical protein [Williamsia deligens]MCP2192435.1 hypothetical protein [Williamsia deligens]
MASRAARTTGSAPIDDAQTRRDHLHKAARWGAVGWVAFMFGSAALALGIAGLATGHSVAAPIGLVVWVVLYGITVYSIRASARARGDRTLQEHIARVQRTRYLRRYPHHSDSAA